ncbi:MAG: glutamine-hydrolyzing GMP synthase [Rickettsiales bacterium]|jgi:GMP synthase (glutamine-hydrolysing)|nr:glutamine-hydrolyzing GMP synthase [Rickettsiales bacterium]
MFNKIVILDFGSQLTKLIARRIRELNFYSIIENYDISAEQIKALEAGAIILSGGPASVSGSNSLQIDPKIFELNIPIFGICYGQQLIAQHFGAKVLPSTKREFGKAEIQLTENHDLFNNYADLHHQQVWMSHGDTITDLPEGFRVIAKTENAPFACIANDGRKIYGTQFHPEVVHSINGDILLKNFLEQSAGLTADWFMVDFIEEEVARIKAQVGDKKVICGLSGGVDSSVAAAIISKAIGKNLTCIYVDNGLMRHNESVQVEETFTKFFDVEFIHVKAGDRFLSKLAGVSDPEQKRKIIGKEFIEIFEAESKKIEGAKFLAQGTLYPDVIESKHPNLGASVTIKSHHNVGGLPDHMELELVEPLRELFKDEVRELGRRLDVPEEIVGRHPFPGPGLGIRIMGDVTVAKTEVLRKADYIYISELKKAGLYDKIWQAFAVLLPVKTVGVMGDQRTYENVLALRAVTSKDGMTAEIYPFEMEFLAHVSTKIINEVSGINRVTYDITSKPPGTIEWE